VIYLQELVYDDARDVYVATHDVALPAEVDVANLAAYCQATYGPPLDVAYTEGAAGDRETIGWSFELASVHAEEFGIAQGELVVIPMVRTEDRAEPLLPFLGRQRAMLETAHEDGLIDRLVVVEGDAPWSPRRSDPTCIGYEFDDSPDDAKDPTTDEGGRTREGREESHMPVGLRGLLDGRLPLNRKERFFTGTVFPMIVASDGFEHLGRLLSLCDVPPRELQGDPARTDVQFFTEYGYAESRIGEAVTRLPTAPAGRDTPDILLYFDASPPLLLALEAKMYDVPSRAGMAKQLEVQAELLEGPRQDLSVLTDEQVELVHAALLPAQLAASLGPLPVRVVTWERLLETYEDVAPRYWSEMLAEALRRYLDLVSPTGSGLNSDAKLSGASIVERAKADILVYTCMGRQGGLGGQQLQADIESGTWRTHRYEVRAAPSLPNGNWFSVEAFLARLAEHAAPSHRR
jgi:hypothetical protein